MTDQTIPEPIPAQTTMNGKRRPGRPPKNQNQNQEPFTGSSERSIGGDSAPASPAEPRPSRGIERQVAEIELGLLGMFRAIGSIVGYFDQFDGGIIGGTNPMSTMPLFVDSVCRAARTDARLRGWLLTVVHASAYSDIIMYGAMMLLPILLHHNIISPGLFFGGTGGDDTVQ